MAQKRPSLQVWLYLAMNGSIHRRLLPVPREDCRLCARATSLAMLLAAIADPAGIAYCGKPGNA
jgi:hypothetical protein